MTARGLKPRVYPTRGCLACPCGTLAVSGPPVFRFCLFFFLCMKSGSEKKGRRRRREGRSHAKGAPRKNRSSDGSRGPFSVDKNAFWAAGGKGCLDVENLPVPGWMGVVRPLVACPASVVTLSCACGTAARRPPVGCRRRVDRIVGSHLVVFPRVNRHAANSHLVRKAG